MGIANHQDPTVVLPQGHVYLFFMNRIDELFTRKQHHVLNVYCTAGYPQLTSTLQVMQSLQTHGADLIELGMPYSDPLADGPIIQASGSQAIANGMTIDALFSQLENMRHSIHLPVVLMGYMNPVMQYGFEKFCASAAKAGIDGLILPDLPMFEFDTAFSAIIQQHGLHFIFLITPETTEERIQQLDNRSTGFLYAVSSSSTTGTDKNFASLEHYFAKLQKLQLKNPVLVGFGIKDKATFTEACKYANGAIIGSAYIKALENTTEIDVATKDFLAGVLA